MKRSDIHRMPAYFDRYIQLVDDVDLKDALVKSVQQLKDISLPRLQAVGDRVYAPGKWTVHDIIQHLADTERVFAYRALRFARNDRTSLPGFDQGLFAVNALAGKRPLADLLGELIMVRQSSVVLFDSFDDAMLQREGFCYKGNVSVLALGFTIIGHQMHHMDIIKERYLPLGGGDS